MIKHIVDHNSLGKPIYYYTLTKKEIKELAGAQLLAYQKQLRLKGL